MSNSTPNLTHPIYRADIDGLRAVAILSVVFYHASPAWISGGFVGVDIFFVISGFLISSIIFENLQRDSFSFVTFYSRRVRRIFPALILVLAACFVVGWFLLLADEYRQLGKYIAGGGGFIANFLFWRESGYFDNVAETKPLLHLWSLGIEEQFYIVWPLLLWSAYRKNLNWLSVTIFIVVVSFAVNMADAHADPVADFYSPLARFWELLIGALLANRMLRSRAAALAGSGTLDRWAANLLFEKALVSRSDLAADMTSVAGACLIGIALFAIGPGTNYPSFWSLLPTLGAALLVAAGPQACVNRTILANKIAVWIGLISYPLYLWHWPLLSFARILESGDPPRAIRFGAVTVAFVLAWLTYRFIERPLRCRDRSGRKTLLLIVMMILVAAAGYAANATGGFPSRPLAKEAADLSNYEFFKGEPIADFWKRTNGCFNQQDQTYEAFAANDCGKQRFTGRPKVFLVGDSHAAYLSLYLRDYVLGRRLNLSQYTASFCVPFTLEDARKRCNDINAHTRAMVARDKPDILIMFANYASYQTDPQYRGHEPYDQLVLNTVRDFAAAGARKIIVVGQIPTWSDVLPALLLRNFVLAHRPVPKRSFEGVTQKSLDWDARLRRLNYGPGVTYVSLRDLLCNSSGCLTRVGPDIKTDLVVQDAAHLTPAGAEYIVKNRLAGLLP